MFAFNTNDVSCFMISLNVAKAFVILWNIRILPNKFSFIYNKLYGSNLGGSHECVCVCVFLWKKLAKFFWMRKCVYVYSFPMIACNPWLSMTRLFCNITTKLNMITFKVLLLCKIKALIILNRNHISHNKLLNGTNLSAIFFIFVRMVLPCFDNIRINMHLGFQSNGKSKSIVVKANG